MVKKENIDGPVIKSKKKEMVKREPSIKDERVESTEVEILTKTEPGK